MDLKSLCSSFENLGTWKAFQYLTLRGCNRLLSARVLKGVTIQSVRTEFLECDRRYQGQFLSEAQLTEITRNHPEYEMPVSFLREAFAKGDECYGFLDGDTLAAYGWYSNRPTPIEPSSLVLHFDYRYIYMYKGFTLAKYRGQRLHAIAMTRALEAYLSRGYLGIVSYVEWNNFSSLKSCYRMGYSDFGNIYLARLLGRYVSAADRGCRTYDFRLKPAGLAGEDRVPQRAQTATPMNLR